MPGLRRGLEHKGDGMKVYLANGPFAGDVDELPDFKEHEIDGVIYKAETYRMVIGDESLELRVGVDVAFMKGTEIPESAPDGSEAYVWVDFIALKCSELKRVPGCRMSKRELKRKSCATEIAAPAVTGRGLLKRWLGR